VVFSAPVWLAAKIVGAEHPTLLRAALSLIVGALGSAMSMFLGGGFALLLAPLAFLLAFKYVLGTSFFGAIGLAVVALLGYAAMVHFIGSGVRCLVLAFRPDAFHFPFCRRPRLSANPQRARTRRIGPTRGHFDLAVMYARGDGNDH